jgi:hypothetical protein
VSARKFARTRHVNHLLGGAGGTARARLFSYCDLAD